MRGGYADRLGAVDREPPWRGGPPQKTDRSASDATDIFILAG